MINISVRAIIGAANTASPLQYIQSTNNYVTFDQVFAPILMVLLAKLPQYIGGIVPVAPIGEETLTSFANFKVLWIF
jgi:hypothetical protein